jgi:hypothetical protein
VFVNSDCFKKHFTTSLDLILLLDLQIDSQRVINKLRVKSENVKGLATKSSLRFTPKKALFFALFAL